MKIPHDIGPILLEIDQFLKAQGVPPHARPIQAIVEFGKRFGISLPIVRLPPNVRIPQDVPQELVWTGAYTEQIHRWYEKVYGERIKTDVSSKAKIAVLADGDLWEMRLPVIFGSAIVDAKRDLKQPGSTSIGSKVLEVNVCDSLVGITEARLGFFSDDDLSEVYGLFLVGLDVRKAFDRFRGSSPLFVAAEDDWMAAVSHMLSQSPNWGHARWSLLQMTEKFMKGIISLASDVPAKKVHNLMVLHDTLASTFPNLKLKDLLSDVQCGSGVRYGEPSTRHQAYSSQKASLLTIRVLGSVC